MTHFCHLTDVTHQFEKCIAQSLVVGLFFFGGVGVVVNYFRLKAARINRVLPTPSQHRVNGACKVDRAGVHQSVFCVVSMRLRGYADGKFWAGHRTLHASRAAPGLTRADASCVRLSSGEEPRVAHVPSIQTRKRFKRTLYLDKAQPAYIYINT